MTPVHPEWIHDPETLETRLYYVGQMRIIGKQRARTLRRRGVSIMRKVDVTSTGRHRHAWFVEAT